MEGRHGARVAPRQWGGRGAVEGAPRQQGTEARRAVVGDGARRHVAHVPPGVGEAPDQVHVLAAAQGRVEELGARRHVRPHQDRRARHEGDRAAPAARGPRGARGRARTAPPRSAPAPPEPRPPAGTIRGATAATRGSSKWPSSGPSHPGEGTQSESTKATSALRTAASPALRAPDGPALTSSATRCAPWRSATSLVAPASADASSTTTQATSPSASSSRSSWAGRSRTGTTTVTSAGPSEAVVGRGENAPADTSRRASSCAARPPRPERPPASAARAPGPARRCGTGGAGCPRGARLRRRRPASTGPRRA